MNQLTSDKTVFSLETSPEPGHSRGIPRACSSVKRSTFLMFMCATTTATATTTTTNHVLSRKKMPSHLSHFSGVLANLRFFLFSELLSTSRRRLATKEQPLGEPNLSNLNLIYLVPGQFRLDSCKRRRMFPLINLCIVARIR